MGSPTRGCWQCQYSWCRNSSKWASLNQISLGQLYHNAYPLVVHTARTLIVKVHMQGYTVSLSDSAVNSVFGALSVASCGTQLSRTQNERPSASRVLSTHLFLCPFKELCYKNNTGCSEMCVTLSLQFKAKLFKILF
ncbi:uncharacterized protein PHALS_15400 [Plasmopara halstedii]|uniref:Uncharacterized protein n=1 Tax=Plasmopara halstedii TaxID=4781 RepID=A0A0P1AU18_PLAHL|nr:uncharacterized protein PHALS_15400 [Plasmopara halstedii]CEG44692.1 hypothetical protein PHALS_15400 [Plasmopara halstedii]|eukprot:XP_024581061.1 hypothetical protein PHALS_15400 [Plasmopara halstedii]